MNKKKSFSLRNLIFTILCIILSFSFFALVAVGIQDVRTLFRDRSYYTESDLERALLEENYEGLFEIYQNVPINNSSMITDIYMPVIHYYESAILYRAYSGASMEQEASEKKQYLDELFQEYPEYHTDFENIKRACGLT